MGNKIEVFQRWCNVMASKSTIKLRIIFKFKQISKCLNDSLGMFYGPQNTSDNNWCFLKLLTKRYFLYLVQNYSLFKTGFPDLTIEFDWSCTSFFLTKWTKRYFLVFSVKTSGILELIKDKKYILNLP